MAEELTPMTTPRSVPPSLKLGRGRGRNRQGVDGHGWVHERADRSIEDGEEGVVDLPLNEGVIGQGDRRAVPGVPLARRGVAVDEELVSSLRVGSPLQWALLILPNSILNRVTVVSPRADSMRLTRPMGTRTCMVPASSRE